MLQVYLHTRGAYAGYNFYNMDCIEDVPHFILQCDRYNELRSSMMSKIRKDLSHENALIWLSLGSEMKMFIILGLDFPFENGEIWQIRETACIFVHKMYCKRYKDINSSL